MAQNKKKISKIITWRSLVSFESLYGMCFAFPSTRADITFPKADNDKLILVASFNLSPVAPKKFEHKVAYIS